MRVKNICICMIAFAGLHGIVSEGLCAKNAKGTRERILLNGTWRSTLGDCRLPGIPDKNAERKKSVIYHRTLNVPGTFAGRRLFLVLERAGESTLWVDGDSIGTFRHPSLPHVYALPSVAGSKVEVALRTSEGIYGDIYIEARDSAYISGLDIAPDAESRSAAVKLSIDAPYSCRAYVRFGISSEDASDKENTDDLQYEVFLSKGNNTFDYRVNLNDNVSLWSEFHPDLYKLRVSLSAGHSRDNAECVFGVRDISADNGTLSVNGNRVFLRGKTYSAAACEDRKQMKEWWWRMLFSKAAGSGVNFWKLGTYSPPEAAFAAADREGIYISSGDASIGYRHPSYIPSGTDIALLHIEDDGKSLRKGIEDSMSEEYGGFLLPDADISDIKTAALMPIASYGKTLLGRNDTLDVKVGVANYTEEDWDGQVEWSAVADELMPETKETLPAFSGRIDCHAHKGEIERAGRVFLPLSMLGLKDGERCRLTLTVSMGGFRSVYVFRIGDLN